MAYKYSVKGRKEKSARTHEGKHMYGRKSLLCARGTVVVSIVDAILFVTTGKKSNSNVEKNSWQIIFYFFFLEMIIHQNNSGILGNLKAQLRSEDIVNQ